MDAKLVVAKGKTTVKEIPVGAVRMIIGRRNDCGLRIPSPLVSRQHCELKCADNRLLVRDLGSSNGTFVNGSKVKQKELKSGDTLGVGPVTFIVQVAGKGLSPSDTARPVAAADVEEDAADFVVAEDVAAGEVADFVAGEDADDGADFVVAEEASGGDEENFVVAEATDDTTVGELADFVASEEPATEAEDGFVVAEEVAADGDTVHNMNAADVKARRSAPPAVDDSADEPAAATPTPAKKPGLFGRLFKKKDKKEKKDKKAKKDKKGEKAEEPVEEKAAEQTPKAKAPAAAARSAAPPAAAAAAAAEAEDDAAFFTSEDDGTTPQAKPVGDDELADFLMGLNEKEQ